MVTKKLVLLILVFALVIITCKNVITGKNRDPGENADNNNEETDPALNGTWESTLREITYNNGNLEFLFDNVRTYKGTYTTINKELKTKITHLWGTGIFLLPDVLNLEARWYTKEELQPYKDNILLNLDTLMTEASMNTYSVSNDGKYLTLNGTIWTRK